MKNLKLVFSILFVAIAVVFVFISMQRNEQHSQKLTVATTTFALYDITKHIAGNTLNVVNILPFGVDPHSFEPTPKLMITLQKSAIVFYSGAGLEPWTHGFHFPHKAVDISKFVKLRTLSEKEEEHHEEHTKHEHHHDNGLDPHYWLDFDNMKTATKVITQELINLLPQNKKLYEANEKRYIAMLDNLDASYRTALSSCKNDTVIMSHNALGYLAQKYHFKVASLSGLSPEAAPSAQDVNRIFRDIKEQGINTIFFENFVNDKLIKTIANDAKIKFELFEPLGNITADEANAGATYEEIMKKNLKKLQEALQCR